jgi:FkbM family methyltransferase
MKKIIQSLFNSLGYQVVRKGSIPVSKPQESRQGVNSRELTDALTRLKNSGLRPVEIIDVGAAKGDWSAEAMMYWPESYYTLFEPIKEYEPKIRREVKQNEKAEYVWGVAGATKGSVSFSVSDDMYGSGVYGNQAANTRAVPVFRLDQTVQTQSGSILVKLDTHGFEMPILEGAADIWSRIDALIIEVYGFYVSPTAPLFHELSAHLFAKGFRLYDVIEVMRRPTDGAFWQADAIYLPNNHPVFQSNSYQ